MRKEGVPAVTPKASPQRSHRRPQGIPADASPAGSRSTTSPTGGAMGHAGHRPENSGRAAEHGDPEKKSSLYANCQHFVLSTLFAPQAKRA